jgi:CheY-like chemotaxis protein
MAEMPAPKAPNVVMVVEDDNDVRESLAEVLADHEYEALPAANGREALDRLRAAPVRPCVILLDIMMPVMDGFEFRTQQLADAALSSIPVIVLTAHADAAQAASDMHAIGALRKPVHLDVLLEAIDRVCRQRAS